jgi:hypothetical protein
LYGRSAQELGLTWDEPDEALSPLGELNLSEQENENQGQLAQAVLQYFQKLILDNTGAVVLVVLNSNSGLRSTSLDMSPYQRYTSLSEDYCDDHHPLGRTLHQRQGA